MQAFFERHPPMLPGAFPGFAGHGAFLDAVIRQPPLRALGTRLPDFMWIARHSGAVIPVLIEIEDPNKEWIAGRKPVRQHAHLTQALAQLREWREWLDRPANQQTFLDTYQIPLEWRRRRFQPRYVLIYGRAGDDRDAIGKIRADNQSETLLTYDHLEPNVKQDDCICVRNDGSGRYTAVEMPACAPLEPTYADWWRLIEDRRSMVERNTWLSAERKVYLLDRINDWDAWAKDWDTNYEAAKGHRPRRMRG